MYSLLLYVFRKSEKENPIGKIYRMKRGPIYLNNDVSDVCIKDTLRRYLSFYRNKKTFV